MAPAAKMAPMNYLQVLIAFLADVILFDYKVQWTDIVGTVLVLLFTFLSVLQKGGYLPCCAPKAPEEATKVSNNEDNDYQKSKTAV